MSVKNFIPHIASLPLTVPFVGPEVLERARERKFRARIGANESAFGPSPKAVEAMQKVATKTWMYADPDSFDLRTALAEYHGVRAENIVVGEGIDGLLGYTTHLFVEPGIKVVTSLGAYPTFNFHVAGCGGELVTVPYRDYHEDPDALLECTRTSGARLLYISNPDNPMGTWWSREVIEEMMQNVPERAVLILDEAYCEFLPAGTLPPIEADNPNVLRFRTFSKAYGMAGVRVGYAIGEAGLIEGFDKIRNHFGVNRFAQAGALVALRDEQHLAEVIANVSKARKRITQIAADHGLEALESATNFVSVNCGKDANFAQSVMAGLYEKDVFVRVPGVAPLNRWLRIGAGTPADLDIFEEAFAAVLHRA